MGWLKIDDAFADSPKVDNLSDGAIRLWVVVACWLRQPKQAALNGFIPAAALETVTRRRWPAKTLAKLANELVNANVGGLHASGLWEPVEGGWFYHDWQQFQPTDEETLTPAEKGRIGGIKSAESRRERTGTALPVNAPNRRSAELASVSASENKTEAASVSASAEPASTENTEAAEAPSPLSPLPDQISSGGGGSKDLTAPKREDAPLPPPPSVTRVRSEARPANAVAQSGQGQPIAPQPAHSEPPRPIHPSAGNVAPLATRRVRATDDLMSCPVGELAKRCRLNQHDAAFAPLGERPELVRVNQAWARAVGLQVRPLGSYGDRNRPLTALLEAFEVATEDELLRACEAAARDDWCCGRKGSDRDQARKRDIGCLSQTVLRRLLDAAAEARPTNINPRVAAMLAEEERRRSGT